MICAVNSPRLARRFRQAVRKHDLPALQMAVNQQIFGQLPGSGWQFYTSSQEDQPFALAVSGVMAQACGQCDLQELGSFLHFLGVEQLAWRGECPPGFHAAPALCQLKVPLDHMPVPKTIPEGYTLQKQPSMLLVTQLVAQAPELAAQGQKFIDDFYARSCILRNHSGAEIWALADSNGDLAATAGLYAIGKRQAFLSGVHTRYDRRGRGLGGWLIQTLAHHIAKQKIETVLWCQTELVPFYRKLGFVLEEPMPQFFRD